MITRRLNTRNQRNYLYISICLKSIFLVLKIKWVKELKQTIIEAYVYV